MSWSTKQQSAVRCFDGCVTVDWTSRRRRLFRGPRVSVHHHVNQSTPLFTVSDTWRHVNQQRQSDAVVSQWAVVVTLAPRQIRPDGRKAASQRRRRQSSYQFTTAGSQLQTPSPVNDQTTQRLLDRHWYEVTIPFMTSVFPSPLQALLSSPLISFSALTVFIFSPPVVKFKNIGLQLLQASSSIYRDSTAWCRHGARFKQIKIATRSKVTSEWVGRYIRWSILEPVRHNASRHHRLASTDGDCPSSSTSAERHIHEPDTASASAASRRLVTACRHWEHAGSCRVGTGRHQLTAGTQWPTPLDRTQFHDPTQYTILDHW